MDCFLPGICYISFLFFFFSPRGLQIFKAYKLSTIQLVWIQDSSCFLLGCSSFYLQAHLQISSSCIAQWILFYLNILFTKMSNLFLLMLLKISTNQQVLSHYIPLKLCNILLSMPQTNVFFPKKASTNTCCGMCVYLALFYNVSKIQILL